MFIFRMYDAKLCELNCSCDFLRSLLVTWLLCFLKEKFSQKLRCLPSQDFSLCLQKVLLCKMFTAPLSYTKLVTSLNFHSLNKKLIFLTIQALSSPALGNPYFWRHMVVKIIRFSILCVKSLFGKIQHCKMCPISTPILTELSL